jgi:hypothetical protein
MNDIPRPLTIALAATGIILAAVLSLWAVGLLTMAGLWPSW